MNENERFSFLSDMSTTFINNLSRILLLKLNIFLFKLNIFDKLFQTER